MRTPAQETAPQIGLRDRSRETWGRSVYKILVKGKFKEIQSLLYKRRSLHHQERSWWLFRHEEMQRLRSLNQSLKIPNYLKSCSTRLVKISPKYSVIRSTPSTKGWWWYFLTPFNKLKLGLHKPLCEYACTLSLQLFQFCCWRNTALGKIPDVFLTCPK